MDRPEDYVKEPKTAEMVDVPQEKTLSEKPLTLMDKIVGQNDKRNKRDVSSSESSFEEANLKKAEDKTPPVTDHETSTEDSSGKENLKDSMTEEAKEPAIEDTKEPMSEEETKEPMKEEEEEKKEEKPNKTDENLTVKQDDLLDLKVASGANAQVDEVMKPENSMKEETKEKDEKIKEDEKIISESTKETVEPMEPIKVNVESEMTKMEHFSGMTDSSIKIKGKGKRPIFY